MTGFFIKNEANRVKALTALLVISLKNPSEYLTFRGCSPKVALFVPLKQCCDYFIMNFVHDVCDIYLLNGLITEKRLNLLLLLLSDCYCLGS